MSVSNSYSIRLGYIISNITLYTHSITLIFGIIGSICNLITFSSHQMRQSRTVLYLYYVR